MEDSRFRPEDEDNQDATVTPKKRRGHDFLSQYLLRRREIANPDSLDDIESDDEDEEETTGTPKRWRRFFRGAFKNVVPPPESPRNEREHGFDPNTWFSWQSAARLEESQQHSPEQTSGEQSVTSETSEGSQPESPEVQHPEETIHNSEHTRTIPEAAPQNVHEGRPYSEAQSGGVIHERLQSSNVVEREVIIERGVGAALPVALVGMEYLARKSADKKLKRSFTREVDSLKMRASQSETTRNELDAIVRQNREQLEALKRDRGMTEKRGTTKETYKNTPEKIPSKSAEKRTNPMESTSRIEKQSEVQPRMIFESVANAAEQDVPVERVFERSHEIKDDKTATAAAAASVGTIMASQSDIQKIIATLPVVQSKTTENMTDKTHQSIVAAYDQAIKMGFIAAVAIIILGTVAYLMVK